MKLISIFIIHFITVCGISTAQPDKSFINELQKQGELDWSNTNYKLCVPTYEKLINYEPDNTEYHYRLGVSNFLAGFDPSKSVKILEKLMAKADVPADLTFWIAQCYMYLYEFADAIDMFSTYISSSSAQPDKVKNSQRFVEMCNSAVELMNKPVNVSFENLGPNVNSTSNDFNPLVPENEGFLVFSSDKKFDEGPKMFIQNIYISHPEKNGWSFAAPLNYINSQDNEKSVGLSHDGKQLFVCGNFSKLYSDVNIAVLKGKNFKYDKDNNWLNKMGNKLTTGASMSSENNVVYFSALREDTRGEGDIYYIRKLPNGNWGKPKNLGDIINTPYDECYPNISPDGKILYFAGKGHNSMGGYDLFVSYLNEITGEWSQPLNVGYPINTPGDDLIISFSKDRRYAYTSSVRKEGMGGLDIYRVTFRDIDEPISVIRGKVKISEGTVKKDWDKPGENLDVSVYDTHSNLFGKYIYNSKLGRFVTALPKGNFKIVIKAPGFEEYSENISILDRNLFQPDSDKEFVLVPKK